MANFQEFNNGLNEDHEQSDKNPEPAEQVKSTDEVLDETIETETMELKSNLDEFAEKFLAVGGQSGLENTLKSMDGGKLEDIRQRMREVYKDLRENINQTERNIINSLGPLLGAAAAFLAEPQVNQNVSGVLKFVHEGAVPIEITCLATGALMLALAAKNIYNSINNKAEIKNLKAQRQAL